MYQQRVQTRPLNGLRGIGVVLAVVAAAVIGSAFFTLLENSIGSLSSLCFILYGCGIAWLLLTRYVLGFVYATDGNCLRVSRIYGKRERFMCEVWFNSVLAHGSPEDVRQRYPQARVCRAVKSQCELAPFAIAYDDDGKAAILILQPNDDLRARLLKAVKK